MLCLQWQYENGIVISNLWNISSGIGLLHSLVDILIVDNKARHAAFICLSPCVTLYLFSIRNSDIHRKFLKNFIAGFILCTGGQRNRITSIAALFL